MIASESEYEHSLEYVQGLERTLHNMRNTLSPSQYKHMSESYLKELGNANRDIMMYLATSPPLDEAHPQGDVAVAA